MELLTALLLAVALSIDGFAVGLAYGLRKIKVTLPHIFLITLCAALAMTLSLFIGRLVSGYITNNLAGVAGGIILILIGLWQILEGLKKYNDNPVLLTINLKTLGLVLQVIRQPENADMDKSGDINCREALLLGVAVNVDVMAAGFGAGLAGHPWFLVPVVSLTLLLALLTGLFTGKKCATEILGNKGYILPGIILIVLGLADVLC